MASDNRYLTKFELQRLLQSDLESRDNIKNISRIYLHNVTLTFNVNIDLHFELNLFLIDENDKQLNINDFDYILSYFKNVYDYEEPISCNGSFVFKGDDVGIIVEWYLVNDEFINIGLSCCIDNQLDENIVTINHLKKLEDKVRCV